MGAVRWRGRKGALKDRAAALQVGLQVVCCNWSTELEAGRSRAEERERSLDSNLQVRAGKGTAGTPRAVGGTEAVVIRAV